MRRLRRRHAARSAVQHWIHTSHTWHTSHMSIGRVLSTCVAAVTVAGCAVLVIGMSRADADHQAAAKSGPPTAALTEVTSSIPAQLPAPTRRHHAAARAATSRPAATPTSHAPAPPSATATSPTPARPAASTTAAAVRSTPRAAPTSHLATTTTPAAPPPATHVAAPPKVTRPVAPAAAPKRGQALPLRYTTGHATRVITVVAHSASSTTAKLQAWNKAPGGGWLKSGRAVTAHVGSDGLSTSPSEYRSATPIGSFTLTQAFGHNSDPGTTLPYFETTSADWWISQAGPLYNTHQHCSSNCAFRQGAPNEHLYYETPFYNYAVVIDYNTRNTGHVQQNAGSAFFLHVTDGNSTAGCGAIPSKKLVKLMRSLTPHQHPRILIGVA
jgi:L,D-peptidoglycan transpeptidase YkuD (ErfK/YbiS/YcfS/YnhG family)